ncbi:hypothetical protein MCOR21_010937, partial [Pyricularia oryzae]
RVETVSRLEHRSPRTCSVLGHFGAVPRIIPTNTGLAVFARARAPASRAACGTRAQSTEQHSRRRFKDTALANDQPRSGNSIAATHDDVWLPATGRGSREEMASEYAAPLSPAAGGLSDLLQQHGSRDYLGTGSLSPPKRRDDTTTNEITTAMRTKKAAPRLGRDNTGDKGSGGSHRMKPRLSSNQMPRSLLPVTERKSQDENRGDMRKRKGSIKEKTDIAPDGASAGREGRQFAVANVGNNGRIYLRPTIRPAHQRYPQPNFVFPSTPPTTAQSKPSAPSTDKTVKSKNDSDITKAESKLSQILSSQWTLPPTPSTSATRRTLLAARRGRHRRAVSDSTVPDLPGASPESEADGLKIVITQPKDDQRPKSVEDRDPPGFVPVLDVSIPNWKLGTPRFTHMGGADIRGSSYGAPTEIRSDSTSIAGRTPRSIVESVRGKKPSPISIPSIPRAFLSHPPTGSPPIIPMGGLPLRRATYISTFVVIEPRMFDDLTFKPACDDRSIVRYSPHTGTVTAASPPRLVAEITSPSFLDYELLSDFFLTFRSFLEPYDLLKMLVARLRWALAREDETGMVVRVRTFVALRHWILNYFMDDFVIDYQLRTMFCELTNDFVSELCQDQPGSKVQVKILGELKKCWRRVCAQYWDSPQFDSSLGAEAPIIPGGIAGHRNADLTPVFWTQNVGDEPPQLGPVDCISPSLHFTAGDMSLQTNVPRTAHMDAVIREGRPATPLQPDTLTVSHKRPQPSSLSVSSIDAMSCSFPTKNLLSMQPGAGQFLAAHPVDPSTLSSTLVRKASTPKALSGKRVRPHSPQHKRNGSLTDSLRDHSPNAGEKVTYKSTEIMMAYPYVGSLVRGAMFPPGQAFVEIPTPGSGEVSRQTTVFQPYPADTQKEKTSPSAMSGQGMRKLLSSVRRAIGTKGQALSPTQGSFLNISPLGPRGATTNRLPGTAIVPQARPNQNGVRPPVRIDLLGAEVAEDFKKAVREDAAIDAANMGNAIPKITSGIKEKDCQDDDRPTLDVDIPVDGGLEEAFLRPISDQAITSGSKSILIVDDTVPALPAEAPLMTGALLSAALPMVNPSVEAFADSFASAADPSPPNTPPGHSLGTPRQDSYILRHTLMRQSYSEETLPPHGSVAVGISNLQSRPSEDSTRPSMDTTRPSNDYVRQSVRRPPLSGVRGHFRQPSSRSYRSMQSFGRPRHASFTSGMAPQPTIASFDATTFSEQSVDDTVPITPLPQPMRVLRRRPGGDLRGITNVGQLDQHQLRRSRSVGSLTTFTESVHSSFIRSPAQENNEGFVDVVDVMSDDYSQERTAGFSLGDMTQKPAKKPASIFSTYSSTPVMRPSFEAEAHKLAQIPDDPNDNGGVESALAKLEGKYEKKAFKLSMEPKRPKTKLLGNWSLKLRGGGEEEHETQEKKEDHRHKHVGDDTHLSQLVDHDTEEDGTRVLADNLSSSFLPVAQTPRRELYSTMSFLSGSSDDSLSSTPILERGLVEDSQLAEIKDDEWTNRSIFEEEDLPTPRVTSDREVSYDLVEKTNSLKRIQPGDTIPRSSPTKGQVEARSFLFDEGDSDDDSESELSSEMSIDLAGDSDEVEDVLGRKRSDTVTSVLPVNPLSEPISEPISNLSNRDMANIHPLKSHPPSPPMTLVQALQMSPATANRGQFDKHEARKTLPLSPEITPTLAVHKRQPSDQSDQVDAEDAAQQNSRFSVHLPFILAFDSQILAQQFTLIEKDALNEIDWKELIDMRWKKADNSDARSWVDFLRNTDARGVEVVIARFNIMVKWCVSEIVLTQDLEERARCLIKFIHIAAHCRRYRNFATMSQIAIALTSPEVSKLQRTWAMVPASDLTTLQQLEALVSPTRNFYNLRSEMEGGDVESANSGCIPFVGIYTHDLLFNAQRPSEIASSPTTAPLVNFERCRCAASIIKTLLRLLEASSLYTFQPIEGITERCLWMGALSDDEIRKISDGLE